MFCCQILAEAAWIVIKVDVFYEYCTNLLSYFKSFILIALKPNKSLLVKVRSMLTGLSAPCFITILAILSGSVLAKLSDAKPERLSVCIELVCTIRYHLPWFFSRIRYSIVFIMQALSPYLHALGSSAEMKIKLCSTQRITFDFVGFGQNM